MQWIVQILGWILLAAGALILAIMQGVAEDENRAANRANPHRSDRAAALFFVITLLLTAGLGAVMVRLSWPW